jgi:hypothetical protein
MSDKTLSAEKLAILFHDKYEALAPSFGYETREETKKFNPDSPNGKLMIKVCEEILSEQFKPILTDQEIEKKAEEVLSQIAGDFVDHDCKRAFIDGYKSALTTIPLDREVYVAVSVEDELPPVSEKVICFRNDEWVSRGRVRDTESKFKWSLDAAKGLTLSNTTPTHWLKKTKGYVTE